MAPTHVVAKTGTEQQRPALTEGLYLNAIMGFIGLEKGIFLETFFLYKSNSNAWRIQHQSQAVDSFRARSLLPSALQCSIYASPAEPLGLDLLMSYLLMA